MLMAHRLQDMAPTPRVKYHIHIVLPCSPFTDLPAYHEYILTTVFLVDMALKFRLAYRDQEQLIGDPRRIRQRYFW